METQSENSSLARVTSWYCWWSQIEGNYCNTLRICTFSLRQGWAFVALGVLLLGDIYQKGWFQEAWGLTWTHHGDLVVQLFSCSAGSGEETLWVQVIYCTYSQYSKNWYDVAYCIACSCMFHPIGHLHLSLAVIIAFTCLYVRSPKIKWECPAFINFHCSLDVCCDTHDCYKLALQFCDSSPGSLLTHRQSEPKHDVWRRWTREVSSRPTRETDNTRET